MAIKKTYAIKDDSLIVLPTGQVSYVLVQTSKEGSTTTQTDEITVSATVLEVKTTTP